jgi:hypothetical protein
MRQMRLVLGIALLIGGLLAAGYFIVHRNEFEGGDRANSIPVSILGHDAPVGKYMNLVLAGAAAVIASVWIQLVRKNWHRE